MFLGGIWSGCFFNSFFKCNSCDQICFFEPSEQFSNCNLLNSVLPVNSQHIFNWKGLRGIEFCLYLFRKATIKIILSWRFWKEAFSRMWISLLYIRIDESCDLDLFVYPYLFISTLAGTREVSWNRFTILKEPTSILFWYRQNGNLWERILIFQREIISHLALSYNYLYKDLYLSLFISIYLSIYHDVEFLGISSNNILTCLCVCIYMCVCVCVRMRVCACVCV